MRPRIKLMGIVAGLATGTILGSPAGAEDLGEAATNPVSNPIQFRL